MEVRPALSSLVRDGDGGVFESAWCRAGCVVLIMRTVRVQNNSKKNFLLLRPSKTVELVASIWQIKILIS